MTERDGTRPASAGAQPRFGLHRNEIGRITVIAVRGALDMVTAPRLHTGLGTCRTERPAAIIVDLSEVDFLASAGMAVLAGAAEAAARDGVAFSVVARGPATSRPLQLTNLADVLRLQPTLEEALSEVRRALW